MVSAPSLCSKFLWESQRDKISTYRVVQHNQTENVFSAEIRTRLVLNMGLI